MVKLYPEKSACIANSEHFPSKVSRNFYSGVPIQNVKTVARENSMEIIRA